MLCAWQRYSAEKIDHVEELSFQYKKAEKEEQPP